MILYNDLGGFAGSLHGQFKSVGLTTGCFDMLHPGHLWLLEQAKGKSDIVIVGVNSDDSVRRIKGDSRPILKAYERAQMLSALRCVDHVIIFDEDDPCRLVEAIQPDLFFKGDDWRNKPMPERAVVEQLGGHVVFVPRYRDYSTTLLASAMKLEIGPEC